jgi:homoserine O-succinyltransferase
VRLLADPEAIERTENVLVPTFLRRALAQLGELALA